MAIVVVAVVVMVMVALVSGVWTQDNFSACENQFRFRFTPCHSTRDRHPVLEGLLLAMSSVSGAPLSGEGWKDVDYWMKALSF